MLSLIQAHVLQFGGASLVALTVGTAAAMDAGAGGGAGTTVQSHAQVEAGGVQVDHHTVTQAELSVTADVPANGVGTDVEVAAEVVTEARADGGHNGIGVSVNASSLELATGLRADSESDFETTVALQGDGDDVSLDVTLPQPEVMAEAEANADAGLSLSLDGEQVNAGVTGEVAGGLALR